MFKHKGDQRRHVKYGHRKSKDFPCKVCGKLFQSPQSRSPHEKKCFNLKETEEIKLLDDISASDLATLLRSMH